MASAATPSPSPSASTWSREHPYHGRLSARHPLTSPDSAKDVQHLEIDLEDSGITWQPGDSLAVLAANDPQLVAAVVDAAGFSADCEVRIDDHTQPIHGALARREITRIPKAFVKLVAERSDSADFARMLEPANRAQLSAYTNGRDMLDVLDELAGLQFTPEELVGALRPIQPRLYSIASSQAAHPRHVHLTVGVVTWESEGRARHGVASTWLGRHIDRRAEVPCYVHEAKKFRLPADDATPIIMVGPGTGIAPFRAFIQERLARQASGRNWLFFGEQHRASDYLYREELEAWHEDGTLANLDVAFSRDQEHKVYVQHLMWERRDELWRWLVDGAHFYVCGDALRMAKDVDETLHRIANTCGGLDDKATKAWIKALKKDRRYQRDVYAV